MNDGHVRCTVDTSRNSKTSRELSDSNEETSNSMTDVTRPPKRSQNESLIVFRIGDRVVSALLLLSVVILVREMSWEITVVIMVICCKIYVVF